MNLHTKFDKSSFIGLDANNIDWRTIVQNDPELAAMYNTYVQTKSNYLMINIDYSSLEIYVLAYLSKCKKLIDAVNSGMDIHALNAANIHHIDYPALLRRAELYPDDAKVKQELKQFAGFRKSAKSLTFSLTYMASVNKIASDLRITQVEAQKLIDGFYDVYPEIRDWQKLMIASAIATGYVEDAFGRRRDVSILRDNAEDAYAAFVDEDEYVIKKLKREKRYWDLRSGVKWVGNTPTQSTGALMCASAACKVNDWIKANKYDAKFMWFVHDAVTLWTHKDCAVDVIAGARSIMENDVKCADDPVKYATSLDIGYNYEFMTECKVPSSKPLTLDYIMEQADKALEEDNKRKFKLLVKSTATVMSDEYVDEVAQAKQDYYDKLVKDLNIEGVSTVADYMAWAHEMSREDYFAAVEREAEMKLRGMSWDDEGTETD